MEQLTHYKAWADAELARQAERFGRLGVRRHPALVNGAAGLVCTREGQPYSVMAFVVSGGRIVEIDILAGPERLAQIDLTMLDV